LKLRVVARRLGRVRAVAAKFESFSNNTAAAALSKQILTILIDDFKMSLRDAREHLLLAFDDTVISEEEFVLLYDYNISSNLDLR